MAYLIAENAWVAFPVTFSGNSVSASTGTGGFIDSKRSEVVALRDISLELHEGDRLGLIGHNGAGKSTMLRLLAGAYAPTRGRIRSQGAISTLLNATPGINVDGTGRENIVICGLHLGLSRMQIMRKMEEIVAFSDLGAFIDLPVRVYSAGMVTRLGFSIATAVEPEILLLDEGLATGDAQFAIKAETRLNELMARSSILVIASHSEELITNLCTRTVLLEHGTILADGPSEETIKTYHNALIQAARSGDSEHLYRAYQTVTEMVKHGKQPSLELEELGLRYALGLAPDDVQMLQRYKQLMDMQNKVVPAEQQCRLLLAHLSSEPEREDFLVQLSHLVTTQESSLSEDALERANDRLKLVSM